MKIINANNWQMFRDPSIAEEAVYYSGSYPGGTPDLWRQHCKAFACVRYNQKSGEIIVCRDHFGLEPLFYCSDSQQFIFGSSLPAIIKQLKNHPKLNMERVLIECFSADQVNEPSYSNDTFYHGIKRVEPGSFVNINAKGVVKRQMFWQLNVDAPYIHYSKDEDYLEHFSALLNDAVQMHNKPNLAAEFSGGLDSSTVITACRQLGMKPALFTHAVSPESKEDDLEQVHSVVKQFNLTDIQYVDAETFDPITVFNELSSVYSGAPCYVFFLLASNVHKAVAKGQYTTLLSGFGGDECVSSHARNRSFYPELLRKRQYANAWSEMRDELHKSSGVSPNKIKVFLSLMRYKNPLLFQAFSKMSNFKYHVKNHLMQLQGERLKGYPYFPSVRHFERAQLQGNLSQHVRMRVENSAILAKHYGFQYAYPLLHPKLVEFCFRLPPSQKRRNGMGRYLVREYLAQHLPRLVSDNTNKRGDIMPASRQKYLHYLQEGRLNHSFKNLPFEQEINNIHAASLQPLAKILAYMFKQYSESSGIQIS